MREQQDAAEANDSPARRHEHAQQPEGAAQSEIGQAGIGQAALKQPATRRPVMTPAMARQLQRTGGNQAVATLMRRVADEPAEAAQDHQEPDERTAAPADDRTTLAGPGSPPPPAAGDDARPGGAPPAPVSLRSGPSAPAGVAAPTTDRPAGAGPTDRPAGAAPADRPAGADTAPAPGGGGGPAARAATPASSPAGPAAPPAGPATAPSVPGQAGPVPSGPGPAGPAEAAGGEPVSAAPAQDTGPQLGATAPGGGPAGGGAPGGGDDGSGVLAGALDTLAQKRAAVVETAAGRRTRIQQAATAYRESVGRSFTTQAQNVGREFDASVEDINADLARRIQQVRSAETEHVAQAVATAGTEREQLGGLTRDRNASLDEGARTHADLARTTGANEATRAIAGGEERARRASALVDERAGPAAGNEGTAEFIRKVRGGKLPQVQQKLRSSAKEVADGVRQQGTDVAGHITDEAADGRKELTGFFTKATNAVGDSHTETVRAIHEAADAAVRSLQEAAREVTSRLVQDKNVKIQELRAGEATMASAIDQQVTDTLSALDEAHQRDLTELDWAIQQVGEGGGEPESTNAAVADITAEVDRAEGEHQATADRFVTSVEQAGTEAGSQVAARAEQVAGALAKVRTDLDAKFQESVDTARQEMGKALTDGSTQMRAPRRDADSASATAVSDARSGWQRRVTDETGKMAGQVDDGLSKQDSQLNTFTADLDAGLRDARTSSDGGGFWSSVGSFFSNLGDFLLGVVEGIGLALLGLLEGLWTLVTTVVGWIVIAVVVIIAVIVVVLFGWEALLVGLLVIGLVVGLSMAAYYVYLAITQPNLSWRERGRLVGRALFEVGMAALSLYELRGLASVSKLGQVAQLARRMGSLGEAVRAVRLLGSVERVIVVLDRVGNVAEAMRLISTVKRFEDIVRLLDELGTAARALELAEALGGVRALLSALDAFGSGARLEEGITAFGGVARLAELIRAVGGAENLGRYLGQLGGDTARLAQLVEDVGGATSFARYVRALGNDAAALSTLVTDVGGAQAFLRYVRALGDDAARLRTLVTNCGGAADFRGMLAAVGDDVLALETMLRNAGNDPVLLLDLLTAPGGMTVQQVARLLELVAGDVAALRRLRGHVADLPRLLRYLEQAGPGNAGGLADLMDLAAARGFAVDRVERILGLANGNAAEFQRLAAAVRRFPHPPPGAAPNAPVPASIAGGTFRIGAARIVMHRMSHYLERHLDLFFRFTAGNMKADNTLWAAGTQPSDVALFLDEALDLLNQQGRLTAGNLATELNVTLGNGVEVTVMIDSVGGNLSVVSFFPRGGPNIVNFVLEEMRAFRALITGVQ